MFRPAALFIGLRYIRARKASQLISFVSVISMLGVALGVLALIVVLSVINASTSTMREETLKAVPHASIRLADAPAGQALDSAERLMPTLARQPGVLGAAPYVQGEAWLRSRGRADFVLLRGVQPEREARVGAVDSPRLSELLAELERNPDGIVPGTGLASRMGLTVGDELSVLPIAGLLERRSEQARSFRVLGIADFGFYRNDNTALVNLPEAARLFADAGDGSVAVDARLRVDDVFAAAGIAERAAAALPGQARQVRTWREAQASLFNALRLEKTLTGFMLLMIVVIGAVNIVSTLVMVVADKRADIAILRTMGAGRRSIMAIFMTQGLGAGLLGTALGAVLGIGLSLRMSQLTGWLEQFINNRLMPDDVYMISHLQAELQWSDVALVCSSALLISFLATLYPAWRAGRVQPAEVLRYE